jgi:hypothetical protein
MKYSISEKGNIVRIILSSRSLILMVILLLVVFYHLQNDQKNSKFATALAAVAANYPLQ